MSRFNNAQTSDGYTPAATIENVPNGVQVSLHVFNEAIVYQLATGYPGGSWGAERYLAPGFHVLARRASGVRARSAVSGQPAQVTAEVASEEEVSWGATPPGDFHGNHTLSVDVDGNPTYDFDGHVRAQGLDLEAHDAFGSDPLPHSTIRWLREADDVAIARLHGISVLADTGVVVLDALGEADGRARFALVATDSPGSLAAELSLENATVGPLNRLLIDDLGRSSFVQLGDDQRLFWGLRLYEASINLPNIAAHTGATVTHNTPAGTLAAGDLVTLLGRNQTNPVVVWTDGVAGAADQIELNCFNADTAAVDAPAVAFAFLIVNRS